MELWVGIAGAVVIVSLAVVLRVTLERKRDAAVALAAEQMGFDYRRDGRDLLASPFTRFGLFQSGRRKRIKNVMQGHVEEVELLLFDYRFVTGSHRNHAMWRQTVAAFHLPGRDLPEFDLQPERFFHKLGELFGYQDIDFDDSPRFSERYLLRGPNEDDIRDLLGPGLRTYLEDQAGWSMSGGGPWLVIYRRDRRVEADDLTAFVRQAFRLCEQIMSVNDT